MNYRTSAQAPARTLAVRNHSIGTGVVFTLMTSVFGVVGIGFLIGAATSDAYRIGLAAVGVLLTLIGVIGTYYSSKSLTARTTFSIERDRLIVTFSDGRRRDFALDEVKAVVNTEPGDDADVHGLELAVANGETIRFDDSKASGPEHYAQTATAINAFLGSP